MATVEELSLAQQAFALMVDTRHTVWKMTEFYLMRLATSPDSHIVGQLIESAAVGARQARRRLGRIAAIVESPAGLAALTSGTEAMGCTISSATSFYVTLRDGLAAYRVACDAAASAEDLSLACVAFQAAVPRGVYLE